MKLGCLTEKKIAKSVPVRRMTTTRRLMRMRKKEAKGQEVRRGQDKQVGIQ